MASRSTYLRKLSHDQRVDLLTKLLGIQFGNCFICGDPIDLELQEKEIDIDHVQPISASGKDGPDNFAATHAPCNRSKQASDLRVARVLHAFSRITRQVESEGRAPNLNDILRAHSGAKHDLQRVEIRDGYLRTSLSISPEVMSLPVYEDKLSGFQYVFAHLPIEYIHHDDMMNPRDIGKRLRQLVEIFHAKRPQLHIALAWIDTEGSARVRVFDGQHKAAAQILLGARNLPVRIFVNPDTDVLLNTNREAGTTAKQVAFDKSVQRTLGSKLLGQRMNRYRATKNLDDEDESFSEQDLVGHFKGEPTVKLFVIDEVMNSITHHADNKLRDFIYTEGRGKHLPLSYSTVDRTFYKIFVHRYPLRTAFNHRWEEGLNPRHLEIENTVRLMNMITDKLYAGGQFDMELGTALIEQKLLRGEDVPESHLRACRMSGEPVIHTWLKVGVWEVVSNYFATTGVTNYRDNIFQHQIEDQCWNNLDRFLDALTALPMWVNKDLASTVFGSKQTRIFWEHVFKTGQAPGGEDLLAGGGLNYLKMITEDAG